jgi:hypothetical protein
MFGRFTVLTTFLMVSATALMGQGFTCKDDRCCYPDGRCFSRDDPRIVEEIRRAQEAAAADKARRSSSQILETGYANLKEVGEEKPGYGLYSYVLITSNSSKSVALLDEIFNVIPNVQDAGALPKQINILYIPFLKYKENEFVLEAMTFKRLGAQYAKYANETLGAKYAESFYNFQMARTILAHLCNPPADTLRQLCGGDLSRGPFIFTYEKPASTFEPVQAPYLFVDLRDVHERAFAEFVSAYQQQVKSEDVNSGERLNTLRLKLLNLALNAADFVKPIPDALADAIRSAKP